MGRGLVFGGKRVCVRERRRERKGGWVGEKDEWERKIVVKVHLRSLPMLLVGKNGNLRRGEESRRRGEEEKEDQIFFLVLATCSRPIRDSSNSFFFLDGTRKILSFIKGYKKPFFPLNKAGTLQRVMRE